MNINARMNINNLSVPVPVPSPSGSRARGSTRTLPRAFRVSSWRPRIATALGTPPSSPDKLGGGQVVGQDSDFDHLDAHRDDWNRRNLSILAVAVLSDVQTKQELPRVLHGISQVLQGVVLRAGKRLTAKDRQKEKSMREKEAQLERTRAEQEAMRAELVSENMRLKSELSAVTDENTGLRSTVDDITMKAQRGA